MDTKKLKETLTEIDGGRFATIVNAVKVKETCARCNAFNRSINDMQQQYRCKRAPSCIAATLHPDIVLYLNRKLGWVE